MSDEKTLAQIAYETFLGELAKTEHADEVLGAPGWDQVPEHVRTVLGVVIAETLRSFAPALVPEVAPTEQSFAQVGYQAYVASTGGLNYQGLPCPAWIDLPEAIKAAWAAASVGIRSEHEHRFAGDFDLEVSREELAELVAGLDALQRADKHTAELSFPLRSRLRALLFPPEPEAGGAREPEPTAEVDEEDPELEVTNDGEKPEPAPESTAITGTYASDTAPLRPPEASSAPVEKGEVIAADALDPPGGATESPAPERTDPPTSAESQPSTGAPEGNVVASEPVQLPSVSSAPPAPPLPGIEPAPAERSNPPTDLPPSAHEETK
jgi:hypothetical protein